MTRDFRKFVLYRHDAPPGRREAGEGVAFSNGKVAIAWQGGPVTVYDGLRQAAETACAGGQTEIVWAERPAG